MPWPAAPYEDGDKKPINYQKLKNMYRKDIDSHHLFEGLPLLPIFNNKHVKIADNVRTELRNYKAEGKERELIKKWSDISEFIKLFNSAANEQGVVPKKALFELVK